jgi:hypothetical protein
LLFIHLVRNKPGNYKKVALKYIVFIEELLTVANENILEGFSQQKVVKDLGISETTFRKRLIEKKHVQSFHLYHVLA